MSDYNKKRINRFTGIGNKLVVTWERREEGKGRLGERIRRYRLSCIKEVRYKDV